MTTSAINAITSSLKSIATKGTKTMSEIISPTGANIAESGLRSFAQVADQSVKNYGSIGRIANPSFTFAQGMKGNMLGLDTFDTAKYAYLNDASRKAFDTKFMTDEFKSQLVSENTMEAAKNELNAFFKDNAKYDMPRLAIQGIVGTSAAYRVASGGGLYRDKNGEFNIIGIPGI